MEQKELLKFVIILSLIGIVLSTYLTYVHYSENASGCDLSETFSCSTVSQSEDAKVFGLPVALYGLLGYGLLGVLSGGLYWRWKSKWLSKVVSGQVLFFFSVGALVVSGYLTYTEFFLIKAICIFCLVSQVVILGIALLSYQYQKLSKIDRIESERDGEKNKIV